MSDTESQESLDYLKSGFDPSTLTVPRLRSILVSHNIAYPSGAKKPQLVDIFAEKVLPQSRKILSARARARRTSKGITNADPSDAGSTQDEDAVPPPSAARPRSTRKSSVARSRVEDSESETPARTRTRSMSPVKRTPRASSGKHPRPSGEENSGEHDSVRRTVRKTRKSEAPIVKSEDLDDDFPRRVVDSAFSHDNPFQSGSSPVASSRSPGGESRRRSLHDTPARRKSSAAHRRRTDVPQSKTDEGIRPPSRSTFEIPDSQMNGMADYDENGVEASEEFTPEAQLELCLERAATRGPVIARRHKRAARGFKAKGPLWVIFLTMLGGYAAWYRQEKLAVGYCGVGRPAAPIVSSKLEQLPDWAVALAEPECEPCPQHAYCYERLETSCEPDFVVRPHPLALGGLVPLPPTCEPDGEKVRRIKVVADRAVEALRERRAKWECGDLVEEGGKPVKSVEIEEEELKRMVGEKRRKGMGEAEFEELWAGAIGEIVGREEVEVVNDE